MDLVEQIIGLIERPGVVKFQRMLFLVVIQDIIKFDNVQKW